ncbi:MAG TPA: ATP-binding protein [Acidobacteriota bacterium]|nr:ATP-binding protein [Acidobacteriota bacterium]
MAKTIPAAPPVYGAGAYPGKEIPVHESTRTWELNRSMPILIVTRAIILFAGLNLADLLDILPRHLGPAPFLPLFNVLTVLLMMSYLALWWGGRHLVIQLYAQIGIDLVVTTVVVAHTRGIESAFVSFYILIIIYCSLMLGRNGGMVGAALSTILYAGMVMANRLGFLVLGGIRIQADNAAFRISAHSLGFYAVAFLGTYLSRRLHAVQKELQEKIYTLEQLQRLNENIVSSIRSGLITTDLQGRVAVFNKAAEELSHRENSEVLGKPVQSLIGMDLWTRILNNNFFKNARPLRYEEWVTLAGGAKHYLGFSVSPLLDRKHDLVGYILSFQDLTEIKRLEEEVRLKDRMAAVGRMAAGLAHEIRNPLTSMRGSVEILRSHVSLPSTDERLLDILIRESDRLNNFVEDFLMLARPGKYAKSSVELVSLLRDSASLLQNNPEVRDKYDVRLRLESSQIQILGNADQLKQVFWNLAQNALRAMPGGGTLTISARPVPGGGAKIIFEDVGVGMSPEEQEQLFQPFHSGFQGGTGLGLSIVFQIMEDHGGKISFDSEKGKGTKVILTFPAHK